MIEFFHELPLKEQMSQIYKVATSTRMRLLIPYLLQSGLVIGIFKITRIGFEGGVFYKLISDSVTKNYPQSG